MILPDPRLLLLLLLTGGTRPGAPSTAHHRPPPGTALPADGTPPDPDSPSRPHRTDSGFISERTETPSPPEPNRTETPSPPEPNRTETPSPPEPNRTETPSPPEPNRTDTESPSEPNRTDTESPSEPVRTQSHFPSQPNRTEMHTPSEPVRTGTLSTSEPNRTETGSPSEPNRIETHSPSEPVRSETYSPSEPNRTETKYPSEPNRTETNSPSEPNRTDTESPSEPNRTEMHTPSEPLRTGTLSTSEPNRTETESPSEPNRTETESPSEPNRTETESPSEPNRTETKYPSEPNRTETHSPSEPNKTETHTPSEPNRTETESPSEPNRTDTHSPSEPNRTDTESPSEPNRTETHSPSEAGLLFIEDKQKVQTVAEPAQAGRHDFYRWDNPRTEADFPGTDGQTSSASGITQKSVTRRHISKRTPHMDTTYISTTFPEGGDQTPLSVTNNTNVSDITENPTTSTTDLDTGPTNTEGTGPVTEDSRNKTYSGGMTQVSVTEAKDSGNTTQGSVTVTRDFENSTETSGIHKTESELSASTTYPLQTPSYVITTYPSPTSHQASESSAPFTSIPVTAPNTTSHVQGTDFPASESTFVPSSPTSTNSSLSTFPASSSSQPPSSFSEDSFNQSSSDASFSSPRPSTLVSSSFSTFFTFPPEASSTFTSTKSSSPQTTLLTTPELPSLSSSPSAPPSLPTTSSTDDVIGTSASYRTSLPPTRTSLPPPRTDQTSGAYNISTTSPRESHTTESGQRFLGETTTAFVDLGTTLRSIVETQTSPVTSLEDRGPPTIATTHVTEPSAQPTSPIPLTTSVNLPIPSPSFTTQGPPLPPQDIPKTTRPALTTGDPNKEVTSVRTTSMDTKTEMPKVETTTSNKEKKAPAQTTAQPAVVTAKYSTTTAAGPPTPAAPPIPTLPAPVSVCSPNPCHNGGSCVQRGGHRRDYRCECPAAWQGQHCERDVDECLSRPCPAMATCLNLRGSFACRCPLGYILENGAACVQVRTFLGHIEIPRSLLNGSDRKYTKLQEIEEEIVQILNSSFSLIGGYYQSSVTNSSLGNRIELSVRNIFLLSSNVTLYDLRRNIQRYKKGCQSAPDRAPACQLILHPELYYIAVSLCKWKNPGCDNETAECGDPAGIAQCQCKAGYFKYSATDRSCRACDDGYQLQDGVCARCPFGMGGFNCSNPYQLITVIISAAGGGLLLILGIALTITCCRKSKHDISKLIFKSGDFQMSPYAEYPKTPRSSDWGRETIEMQENGSTKNLLQMTDVYYPPGLRNSEIERNGLYPFTGLPGSRHSCIYPGQYNPSFINEENRRRDYF
ncbi:protein HEG homolog 1 isoform X2 [Rana temporaria]|uniref:protein HEG homolog 1 isoform X2 n=1 Tax=Rana temporaria TaxID=8407 RepID=UPI001AAC78DE|nr:protein HEG homolog 1 isoform X2 [Rana temporaria]